nr:membrane-spanning 4-domains subfamily A member 4A-like [Loxodonta africana]
MSVKKILGVVQILIGLINLTLGITMMSVSLPNDGPKPISVYSGYTIWGSVVFIVSGALLIPEENRGYRGAYLNPNFISSVVAIIGITITALSLRDFSSVCEYTLTSEKCAMLMGMDGVVLTLSVLEFCINVSLYGLSQLWWHWWLWL